MIFVSSWPTLLLLLPLLPLLYATQTQRGGRKYSFSAFFTEETDVGDAEGDRLRRQEKKEKGGNLW